MRNKHIILFLLSILIPVSFAAAQSRASLTGDSGDSLAILKRELAELRAEHQITRARLDSLLVKFYDLDTEEESEADLMSLLDEANQLAEKEAEQEENVSKKFHSGVRQQQGLNPNISLGGDFFGAASSTKNEFISEAGDTYYGNNGFFLREVELALEAPLDPFTRGKTFISVTKDAITIEEAYMEWLNLPLKMNLKIGIFYSEFGPLNRYHDHALPQFDRPRALVNLFSNKGLGGTGLASSFMLPEILFASATTLDLTVINGTNTGENFSFADKGLLYMGQFKNFYDISQNSYFEIRLSGVTGKNPSAGDNRSYIGSAGLTYKWVPMGREKYRTFDWKTEFFYSHRNEITGAVKSIGFYSTIQNKISARFWIGARAGYSELPYDNRQSEWDYSINLDFWQSEFVFTRIQYQYNRRFRDQGVVPVSSLPHDHTIFLQVCWAMGPHKHEAY